MILNSIFILLGLLKTYSLAASIVCGSAYARFHFDCNIIVQVAQLNMSTCNIYNIYAVQEETPCLFIYNRPLKGIPCCRLIIIGFQLLRTWQGLNAKPRGEYPLLLVLLKYVTESQKHCQQLVCSSSQSTTWGSFSFLFM